MCQDTDLRAKTRAKPAQRRLREEAKRGGRPGRLGVLGGTEPLGGFGLREREVAGRERAAILRREQRLLLPAQVLDLWAARIEAARWRRIGGARHVAARDLALPRRRQVRVRHRNGG